MWSRERLDGFWMERASHGTVDPCHYMNKWMDRYVWIMRSRALKALQRYFEAANRIVDVGCGNGDFTVLLSEMTDGDVAGVDRECFVRIATARHGNKVSFVSGEVPSDVVREMVSGSDVVTLLTVYDFMSAEDRNTLLKYLARRRRGSVVIVLDLFVDSVPWYHKDIGYKKVDDREKKVYSFNMAGYDMEREVVVNRIDTRMFHYVGKNAVGFIVTMVAEKIAFWTDPRYFAVVFRKR